MRHVHFEGMVKLQSTLQLRDPENLKMVLINPYVNHTLIKRHFIEKIKIERSLNRSIDCMIFLSLTISLISFNHKVPYN